MIFSVFDVGISGSVVPNFFGPVVYMILAEDFVCIFEVHTEVLLTADVLGILTIKRYQDNALIYA